MAISAVAGTADAIGAMAGAKVDVLDENTASRAGVGAGNKAGEMLSAIPGMGWVTGLFAQKTIDGNKSAYIDNMSPGYSKSVQDINASAAGGGKKMLFGAQKMNSFIRKQNEANELITNIAMESEMARQNDAATLYQSQNFNKYSGTTPRLLMAKKGVKFKELSSARALLQRLTDHKVRGLDINALLTDINSLFNPNPQANVASTTSQLVADSKDGLSNKDVSNLIKNQIYDAEKSPEAIGAKIVENITANKAELARVLKKNGGEHLLFILDDPNNLKNIKILGAALSQISANKSYADGGEVSKYQLGGKIIDTSKNIIPDGALHKNLNHLSDINEELVDQITRKGVPVVSEDAEGNITQHAEVEVGEIIFTLENSQKLERYWKQYKETGDDSIAIECGKFVTHEILRNTVDKAGVKKQIE
jgi:predicted lipase